MTTTKSDPVMFSLGHIAATPGAKAACSDEVRSTDSRQRAHHSEGAEPDRPPSGVFSAWKIDPGGGIGVQI